MFEDRSRGVLVKKILKIILGRGRGARRRKRILIKAAKDDIDLRTWIRNKEARQLLFREGRFQEI